MNVRKVLPWLALGLIAAARPAIQGGVSVEAAIGKSIEANMPVDTASSFAADVGTLVCWTRVTGAAADSKITHVWIHGTDSATVSLTIKGSPFRTYSRKTIPADAKGDWKVEVHGADGAVIATKTFKVG